MAKPIHAMLCIVIHEHEVFNSCDLSQFMSRSDNSFLIYTTWRLITYHALRGLHTRILRDFAFGERGGLCGEFIIFFIFLPNRIGISKTVSLLYKSDTPNINGVSVKKNQGVFWKKKNPIPSSPKGSKRGYIFFHSCSFSFIFFISCFL